MTGELAAVNRCNALLGLAPGNMPSRKSRSGKAAASAHSTAGKRAHSARVKPAAR
jgi:hypothetical protein